MNIKTLKDAPSGLKTEKDNEPKPIKKRTYEQQKENILKYLKNRWENDEDFRTREIQNKRLSQRIRYNDDAEFRAKILESMKNKRQNAKKIEIDNIIKDFESKMENIYKGSINTDDIKSINKMLTKIKKYRPEYIYKE